MKRTLSDLGHVLHRARLLSLASGGEVSRRAALRLALRYHWAVRRFQSELAAGPATWDAVTRLDP